MSSENNDLSVRSVRTGSLGLRRPGPSWVGKGPGRIIHSNAMYSTMLSRTGSAESTTSVERLLISLSRLGLYIPDALMPSRSSCRAIPSIGSHQNIPCRPNYFFSTVFCTVPPIDPSAVKFEPIIPSLSNGPPTFCAVPPIAPSATRSKSAPTTVVIPRFRYGRRL